jgi:hypothetical protein
MRTWPGFAAGSTRNPTPQGLHRLSFRTTPPRETNSRSESGILAGNAHQRMDGPFAGLMEFIMSKTSETSKLSRALLENRDLVADGDLDAVTGGAFDCFFEYTERTLV